MPQSKTLGVICARGGSKGLPDKNIARLDGKPMIFHAIWQAQGAKLLNKCLVSTDSKEIARIAKEYAPDWVRFLRPDEFAADDARIEGTLIHALNFAELAGRTTYDFIVLLLNSHPLRTSLDIDYCIELMRTAGPDVDSVVSGYWIEHPYELRHVDDRGLAKQFSEYRDIYRRQDAEKVFMGNGAVVVTRRACLMRKLSIWGETSLVYPMPMRQSFDIDVGADLEVAHALLPFVQK